jgi:RNA 2',3'-cyclic 3'-phosphodiesterase
MRAFVALRMSAQVEDSLASFVDRLRTDRSGIQWVKHANLHLTLRFLGDDVDAKRATALDGWLAEIAARTQPFMVGVHGTGAFPNLIRPRVIWVGLVGDELPRVAAEVEAAAVRSGFTSEKRPYSPHLTIGRVRHLAGWAAARGTLEAASQHDFGTSRIESMIFYRSILGNETSTYQELARYEFGRR